MYDHNKSVVVTLNIENIAIITNIIHIIKDLPYIAQILPVRLTRDNVPILQRLLRLRMFRVIFNNCALRDNMHNMIFRCKDNKNFQYIKLFSEISVEISITQKKK